MAGDGGLLRHQGAVINAAAATSPLDITLRRIVLAIAALTALSGAFQMVLPDIVLRFIGGTSTPSTRHFFGLVGMFMLIVGAALWVAVRDGSTGVVLVLAAQKAGAVGGVVIGVAGAIFGPLALLVAGFDALSCLLILWYWQRSRS